MQHYSIRRMFGKLVSFAKGAHFEKLVKIRPRLLTAATRRGKKAQLAENLGAAYTQ